MNKLARRLVAVGVLACLVTVSTACYGPFNLTKTVYHWNSNVKGSGEVNSKWMREIVFFGMFVLPVYEFSALLDAFIFNSIHFWTGESPIKGSAVKTEGDTKVATLGETTVRWIPSDNGAMVSYERHGIVERRATVVASATGYRLIDEGGRLLSEAEYGADGSVRFLDGDCRVITQWSRKEISAIAEEGNGMLGRGLKEIVSAKVEEPGFAQ